MSVYKVERKVDTVIVEMSAGLAEKLAELLSNVSDQTFGETDELFYALIKDDVVRYPSRQFETVTLGGIAITYRSEESYLQKYEDEFGTLDECPKCGGKAKRHYVTCGG